MNFLAITPGVHLVEMLTLTDIETGYSVNLKCVYPKMRFCHTERRAFLRSILDVVVHDPRDS